MFHISDKNDHDCYRKALVLILYSHFEGFCKDILTEYVNYINSQELSTAYITPPLKAAAMSEKFSAYDNTDQKCRIFKNLLPDDEKLHKYSRRIDFINEIPKFFSEKAELPAETIVDPESNLKATILKKILFTLGLDHTLCDEVLSNKISRLLEFRNQIAHGSFKDKGITESQYLLVENSTTSLMEDIKCLVIKAATNKEYLEKTSS